MNVACDYEAPMQMLTTEKYKHPGRTFDFQDFEIYDTCPTGVWVLTFVFCFDCMWSQAYRSVK